jgi:hypothetical protein
MWAIAHAGQKDFYAGYVESLREQFVNTHSLSEKQITALNKVVHALENYEEVNE